MRINPKNLPPECFDFVVSGIPCIVCVTHYRPEIPAKMSGHPDSWEPPEAGEFEYEFYDRKGYRAVWLDEKVTPAIEVSIFEKFEEVIK